MKESEEWAQAIVAHYLQLVFVVTGEIPEGKGRLTLHLWRLALHKVDERLHQAGFCLSQTFPIGSIDSNVGECGGAVVLDISIGRTE